MPFVELQPPMYSFFISPKYQTPPQIYQDGRLSYLRLGGPELRYFSC